MLPCSPSNDMRRKMKIKSIIAGFGLTVGSLFIMVSPAQAETCSTGTYTVAGINTFGDLPCKDPGTEINVTVRGLHDYGVPGGPTAYCSFIYVRKNLGTASAPNWSASTDTVCAPKPAPVVVAPTPTPTPTPTSSAAPTPTPTVDPIPSPSATPTTTSSSSSSGSSGSQQLVTAKIANTNNLPINSSNLGGFAIVDQNGIVYDVVIANVSDFGNNDKILQQEYMGCPIGCRVIWQTQADSSGSVNRYISNNSTSVTYNYLEKTFYEKENGIVITKILAPEATKIENINKTTSFEALFFNSSNNGNEPTNYQTNTQSLNSVIVTAIENTEPETSNDTVKEYLILENKVTEEQLTVIVNDSPWGVMKSKIAMLTRLLESWFL